jgi:DNA-binding transcriptional regulator YhcF (GntR family)
MQVSLGGVKRSMRKPETPTWIEDVPIYRQLMDLLVARILDRVYLEEQMLPSVRQLAQDCDVNPLTVAKAYKELAREGFTDRHRGEGLMLRKGVRSVLLRRERSRFMKEEWPVLQSRLSRLGIDLRALGETASG